MSNHPGTTPSPTVAATPNGATGGRVLTLPLNGVYFDQIKAGTKTEEYRLVTPFWRKRIEGRTYDRIVLTRGYPKASDHARRLTLPWRGWAVKTITHPHFGADPVEVFAIRVADADQREVTATGVRQAPGMPPTLPVDGG